MQKVSRMIIIMLIALAILIITFMWGYGKNVEKVEEQNKQITLFYMNLNRDNILLETREVVVSPEDDLAHIMVEELIKGPVSMGMTKAIPDNTKLLDIKMEGTVMVVNFSKEYNNMNHGAEEIVVRASIVNTLCELENVQKVKILVEGKEMIGINGEPIGVFGKNDFVFNNPSEDEEKTKITLYFGGNNGEKLVREEREIVVKDNEIERYVIEELIKGPNDKGLSKTIPPESKLMSIETKEDICFVNFSQEFKTKHWGGSSGELLTIYSVVNSLTELSHIDEVQFLVEGKRLEVFEHMVFDEPFQRDLTMISD